MTQADRMRLCSRLRPAMEAIDTIVCEHVGATGRAPKKKWQSNLRHVVFNRHIAMHLMKEIGWEFELIAGFYEYSDHHSAMYGVNKIEAQCKRDEPLKELLGELREKIKALPAGVVADLSEAVRPLKRMAGSPIKKITATHVAKAFEHEFHDHKAEPIRFRSTLGAA